MEQTHALGRRKTAVARVYLTEGTGNIVINGRPLEDYFKEETLRYVVLQPYTATETLGKFDTKVTLVGGGTKGQAEAVRLGIARALCEIDKEAYRSVLKAAGFLTRDAREVERKKPGQPGARRRFQFSKR
ncbi:MAG: 30S ribosomal protein S9 [Candidatus Cryptobacteroides sp.]